MKMIIEKGVKNTLRGLDCSYCTLKVKYNDVDFFINYDLYFSNIEKTINTIRVININKSYKSLINSINELFEIEKNEIKVEDLSKKFLKKIEEKIKIELTK